MSGPSKIFKPLLRFALVLAFTVIILGAYVRLTDAGLGCPDWPGCYGQLLGVPSDSAAIEQAEALYPERAVDTGKAWREMLHRYLAGILGLVILGLLITGWRTPQRPSLVFLSALVIFQALLGMWTVTLLLQPLIVVLHLLGGFLVLSTLWWICLSAADPPQAVTGKSKIMPWTYGAIGLLLVQIALGGWQSANYAALACPDFPGCHAEFWPSRGYAEGFSFSHLSQQGVDYEYGVLSSEARSAIHAVHRLGALIVLLYFAALLIAMYRRESTASLRKGVVITFGVLSLQIALGISNVLMMLPLGIAVAHNGVAVLLLLATLYLVKVLQRPALP